MNKSSEKPKQTEKPGDGENEYECSQCKDTEFIFYKDEQGYEFAKPCECRERKAWKRRFKQALIPDEFIHANFENFKRSTQYQQDMYDATINYLNEFAVIKHEDGTTKKIIPNKNLGFIAVVGEQRLRELPAGERAEAKRQHNNFGVGKTHLQIALAKRLIKDGFNVLVVSDVAFMDELSQAKRMNDEGETLNRLLQSAIDADVLVWDDIGKAKWSETKESLYYQIINERYRKQKPIVFNSNEDRGTLSEKIGYAAASRLIGQCGPYLHEVEGEDFRLKGA
ncbi:DNA replication protein DnaC [Parageobacillus caldoxylosilyticus]|uniref:ATP-binding protein n=1 Tax=Saccharococcus caldoxylosilyticus TaxID=81408 RepID=UPI001C4E2512|nr:ATP-binding protein [Parageobacillus caldoxylosilyticus]QXJ39556.1 DNA replication protein DnaC [Parageobacillus caldoxylosilyticus]